MDIRQNYDSLYLAVVLLVCCHIFPVQAVDLRSSRDSLETLLRQTSSATDGTRRLELLNHLCDIDLALGDTTYIYPCWQASVSMRDVHSMDDLLIPLAMKAMRRGQADSVKVWQQRCREYFAGPLADCNLEYLQLMTDLRNWKSFDKLSERMLQEQVALDVEHKPYHAMRILYTLGVLSSFEKAGNAKITLKPDEEYMSEALAIARKRPFREATHFTRQILLGLSSENVDYARQYLEFVKRFLDEPDMRHRPFYSRRALISAYEKMLIQGADLPREELDGYYREINILLKQYPNDTPVAPDYFAARVHYRYFMAARNAEEALRWCDSVIVHAPENRVDPYVFYSDKLRLLEQLGRWQEAYSLSKLYMQAKDSVQNVSSEKKLSELQTQYDVDTLRRKEEVRRNQLMLASACGVFLLVALLIYVLYSRRLSAKNKVLLDQLKQYALQLKGEKSEKKERQEEAVNTVDSRNLTNAVNVANAVSPESSVNLTNETSTVVPESLDSSEDGEEPQVDSSDSDASSVSFLKLFMRIDAVVREEKLYLVADFGRADLLERLGTNKNNLATAVQAGTGMNLLDYINELRLRDALLMMEEFPDAALGQISDQTGFGTYSSFYRTFNRRFGVTPKEYKKYILTPQ